MHRLFILLTILILPLSGAQAQSVNSPGADDGIVRIAVLDTGARIPDDYANATVRYYDARPGLKTIEETKAGFSSEHGTWVTNAILEGYDDPVEILSYRAEKICREEALCEIDTATLGRAAMHAWLQGADIIQISSYGRIDPAFEGILASIAAKGIHVVMCAGNEGGASPLLPLARRNPDFIHIVGSLNKRDRRSFFSARDDSRVEPLLRWRLGERVPSRSASGRLTHVTGTSYAASIMTADLARSIAPGRNHTLAAIDPIKQGPRPSPTALDSVIARQQGASLIQIDTSDIDEEERMDTRVALAEGGEIAIAALSTVERARLRSRAIRPDGGSHALISEEPARDAPAPSAPATSTAARTKSRAVRPGG